MLTMLIFACGALCIGAPIMAYMRYKDIFHPVVLIAPMCIFLYFYMPLKLSSSGELFNFVTEDQATFYQMVIVLTLSLLVAGAFSGSSTDVVKRAGPVRVPNRNVIHMGGYILGLIGFSSWAYQVHYVGGFAAAFGTAYGGGWSEYGYVRDASYLTIVALVLLISPEGFCPKSKIWLTAIVLFSIPWATYSLLGARRGPTFIITVCIGMSWYVARGTRPSAVTLLGGGALLGFFMLFLVANRDHICLTCDMNLTTDVSTVTSAAKEDNEYIFGIGCVTTSKVMNKFYWGRRYLAQVLVRPIPRQLWPTKYVDTGLGELEQNAGVAGAGLQEVMGWGEIPGAAATMVADLWVEFSWLTLPVAWVLGWGIGRVWRRAVEEKGYWMTQYVILCVLSIYFVTQSGEAVISRSLILSLPAALVWRKARQKGYDLPAGAVLAPADAGRMAHA